MGDTDLSIGRLEGKMDLVLDEIKTVRVEVSKLKTDGCVRGEANTKRIDHLEGKVASIESGRLSGKDLVKLLGGATGITALITGVVEFIRHMGGKG